MRYEVIYKIMFFSGCQKTAPILKRYVLSIFFFGVVFLLPEVASAYVVADQTDDSSIESDCGVTFCLSSGEYYQTLGTGLYGTVASISLYLRVGPDQIAPDDVDVTVTNYGDSSQ